jgi:hypothetical protein
VEVALLLGVRGRILAAEHTHQAHVVGAVAHHQQRLHEARQTIARDVQLGLDLGRGLRHARLLDRWRRLGGGALARLAFRRRASLDGLALRRRAGGSLGLRRRLAA